MSKAKHYRNILAYHGIEVAVTAGTFFLAYVTRTSFHLPIWKEMKELSEYMFLFVPTVVIWSAIFWVCRSYRHFRPRKFWPEVINLTIVQAFGCVLIFAYLTVTKKADDVNRSFIGVFSVLHFIMLLSLRQMAKHIMMYQVMRGYDRRYVLIVGTGEKARRVARTIQDNIFYGLYPKGYITEHPEEIGQKIDGLEVIGSLKDVHNILQKEAIDEVIVALEHKKVEELEGVLNICDVVGVKIKIMTDLLPRLQSRLYLEYFSGEPVLTFYSGPTSEGKLLVKRFADVVVSGLVMMLFSWLFFLIALAIKLTSRGPIFFRQERAGLNSRIFTLYKFRTMFAGAEKQRDSLASKNEMSGPVFKIKDDPRITWVGRFLRRTSFDELPQVWNVFRGDMSLVGPRPLPVYEVAKFEPWQRRRMSMRPGITCYWQVKGRNRLDFDKWMELDLQYIDDWSLTTDLKILLRTIPAVVGGKGAY